MEPPRQRPFALQPANQAVAPGGTATFTANVTGTGPFAYQWRHNGLPISGATSETLTVAATNAGALGAYDVQVAGGCIPTAIAISKPARLTLLLPTSPTDLDQGGDVDLADFGILQECLSGPGVFVDPNCPN